MEARTDRQIGRRLLLSSNPQHTQAHARTLVRIIARSHEYGVHYGPGTCPMFPGTVRGHTPVKDGLRLDHPDPLAKVLTC